MSTSSTSTPENRSVFTASWWRQFGPAMVSIVLGVAVTVAVFWAARSSERRSVRKAFDSLAEDRFSAVGGVFDQFTQLVAFADNVFMVTPQADSPAFPDYVRSLKTFLEKDQSHYPSLGAITWVPRVPRDEAAAYERAAQAAFDPHFEIHRPAASQSVAKDSERPAFFPSYLCVGKSSRPGRPGEDLSLDPAAWKAMTRSCDTGEAVAMAPLKMSNKADDRFGYRLFQPLYHGGDPGNVAARRRTSEGFLCIDLDVGALVGKAFEDLQPVGIDVWVVDEANGKDVTLCRHVSRVGSPATGDAGQSSPNPLVARSTMGLFGRNVSLYCVSTPLFQDGRIAWQPWAILCIGLALTLAATVYRFNLAARAVAIDRAVDSRMESLRLEMEQQEAKRKQPKPLPTQSPGDGAHKSFMGVPIDTSQSLPTPGEYDASLPQ